MSESTIPPFIVAEGLSLKTPLGPVYEDVSLSVDRGSVCALFGDAGCGKTALLLTLCGRMKESRGTARVGEFDLRRGYRRIRRMSNISFIHRLNDVQPFLRVKSIMAAELSLAGKKGNKQTTDAYLERCHFFDKKDVRFDDLDAYDAAYFGIMLACAGDPSLLCVDDVQSNLTQHQSIKLVRILRRLAHETGMTVLFNCSEYEIARYADSVAVLSVGAEAQRQAVLRELGSQAGIPVCGQGNAVNLDADYSASLGQDSMREPELYAQAHGRGAGDAGHEAQAPAQAPGKGGEAL